MNSSSSERAKSGGTVPVRVPLGAVRALAKYRGRPTRHLLTVSVAKQEVIRWERVRTEVNAAASSPISGRKRGGRRVRWAYAFRERYVASTSRYGIGQRMNSNRTPLGLHRIARKIGGDQPVGTVFKGRKPIGLMHALPEANIVHRILWLDGLQPGFNRGGNVDTFRRYIYIHGFGDETTLGRPQSHGCVHLGVKDLVPLYDLLPRGTLVWIGRR